MSRQSRQAGAAPVFAFRRISSSRPTRSNSGSAQPCMTAMAPIRLEDAELPVRVLQVLAHRGGGHRQPIGDRRIRQSGRDQGQHPALLDGQRPGDVWRGSLPDQPAEQRGQHGEDGDVAAVERPPGAVEPEVDDVVTVAEHDMECVRLVGITAGEVDGLHQVAVVGVVPSADGVAGNQPLEELQHPAFGERFSWYGLGGQERTECGLLARAEHDVRHQVLPLGPFEPSEDSGGWHDPSVSCLPWQMIGAHNDPRPGRPGVVHVRANRLEDPSRFRRSGRGSGSVRRPAGSRRSW